MYRILVTGSREYSNTLFMRHVLSFFPEHLGPPVLVHGAARGADTVAAEAAAELGWEVEPHPADWDKYGKRAGFLRNAEMAALGADICLAFPLDESKGTRMMIDLVAKKGIKTKVFECEHSLICCRHHGVHASPHSYCSGF